MNRDWIPTWRSLERIQEPKARKCISEPIFSPLLGLLGYRTQADRTNEKLMQLLADQTSEWSRLRPTTTTKVKRMEATTNTKTNNEIGLIRLSLQLRGRVDLNNGLLDQDVGLLEILLAGARSLLFGSHNVLHNRPTPLLHLHNLRAVLPRWKKN